MVTTPPSGVTSSAATLNGNVNPEGQTTTYHFEYGTTTSYGTTIPSPDGSAGSGTSAVNESSSLTGLTASTTYHYRLDATNGTGTTNGSDQQFTTSAGGGSSDTVTATVNGSPAGSSLKVLVLTGATEAGGAMQCGRGIVRHRGYLEPDAEPKQLTAAGGHLRRDRRLLRRVHRGEQYHAGRQLHPA